MRMLDVFAGNGGWSKGFHAEGFEVEGIDIKSWDYPFLELIKDVRDLEPMPGYDVIIGSPPCRDFSIMSEVFKNEYYAKKFPQHVPNVARGLELVAAYLKFLADSQPRIWAMENVARLSRFFNVRPGSSFRISKRGERLLWGNFKPFEINIEPPQRIMQKMTGQVNRAEIPLVIARRVAQEFRRQLT